MGARGDTYRGAAGLIRHRFHGPAHREYQCDALMAQFVNRPVPENRTKFAVGPRSVLLLPYVTIQLDVGRPVVPIHPFTYAVTGRGGEGTNSCKTANSWLATWVVPATPKRAGQRMIDITCHWTRCSLQ